MGMQGTPKDQLPKMSQVMKEYGHLALPIIFLVYMLFFSGKTVIMAAFYTIVFTIIVAQCRKNTRMTFQDILDAMVASAKSTAVSYTHLDVYKRQISGNWMERISSPLTERES